MTGVLLSGINVAKEGIGSKSEGRMVNGVADREPEKWPYRLGALKAKFQGGVGAQKEETDGQGGAREGNEKEDELLPSREKSLDNSCRGSGIQTTIPGRLEDRRTPKKERR